MIDLDDAGTADVSRRIDQDLDDREAAREAARPALAGRAL
jgi:hypothetical protein